MSEKTERIKARLMEIEEANCDISRAANVLKLMLAGEEVLHEGEISKAERLDAYRLVGNALESLFWKIDSAREAIESETKITAQVD